MRRRRESQTAEPGQDSFLDIVANLVGILIILVMVVGARAQVAWVAAASDEDKAAVEDLRLAVAASTATAANLESDNNQIEAKIRAEEEAAQLRKYERDQLQQLISAAEHRRDQQRGELDERAAASFDIARQLDRARTELDQLQRRRSVAENATAPVTVIEHLPTPMAKTVFGEEIHFRLKEGRVVYVPMEELIGKMKEEWQVKAEKLRNAPQTVETISAIAGFRLRYELRQVETTEQTGVGVVRQKAVQFEGFELLPVTEPLGEPLQSALQSGSQFRRLIDGMNPEATTITVWVYPDSFNEFLVMKRYLFDRGFLTASWPIPEGQPISGGPNGRRSTAQ